MGSIHISAQIPDSAQESFQFAKFMVFEVPAAIADQVDSLVLKGDPNDHAILCSDDSTFNIKQAETSNLLLLLSESDKPAGNGSVAYNSHFDQLPTKSLQVIDSGSVYFEVQKIQPTPDALRQILSKVRYSGSQRDGPTLDTLLNSVQISKSELLQFLKDISAVEINGSFWLLDQSYQNHVLELVILSAQEEGLELDDVSVTFVNLA